VSGAAIMIAAGLIPGSALAGTAGWSILPSPNPAGTNDAVLSAVACTSDSACMSVGNYAGSAGSLTLAERWNGTSWSIVPTPNRVNTKNGILNGVSCAGPSSCTAVGYTFTARSVQRALVEAWNGTKWVIQPTPLPAGAVSVGLDAVSCTAPDSCMAVGGYAVSGVFAQQQPLAESWNGSTWAIVPTPNPQPENGSFAEGVSCTAANACTAGGNYDYADINQSIFALRWNGTMWVMQKQPNPRGQFNNGTTRFLAPARRPACPSAS
jgi:hypothetical protein